MPTFVHWENRSGEKPRWLGLAERKDGTWEIVLQTPYDELVLEFEECCQGEFEPARAYVVVDLSEAMRPEPESEEQPDA